MQQNMSNKWLNITLSLLFAVLGFLARSWFVEVNQTKADFYDHVTMSKEIQARLEAADQQSQDRMSFLQRQVDDMSKKIDKIYEYITSGK